MKRYLLVFVVLLAWANSFSQTRTIHVFVALCDNQFQGIVPVPESLGDGKNPSQNLYWGAMYGVKSFLKFRAQDWVLVEQLKSTNPLILERILFKHAKENVYLLADAYDGEHIKTCTEDFLRASNAQNPIKIKHNSAYLSFGGAAGLLAYIGHDGLMDFDVNIDYKAVEREKRDVIILACYSEDFFTPEIEMARANPLLWTTHLMAPEAYTLKAAIDGWMKNETGSQIEERAAQAYHKYQKCGMTGARNLFTTGFND